MKNFENLKLETIFAENEFAKDFFVNLGLPLAENALTFEQYLENLSEEQLEACSIEKNDIFPRFGEYLRKMQELIKENSEEQIKSITLIGGRDKDGKNEFDKVDFVAGKIVSIVGPTGSGKSRLLADVELLTQGDTITNRKILVNGKVPCKNMKLNFSGKLVAQLSQNMNFVMDLTVEEFLLLHIQSRMVNNCQNLLNSIVECANELSGEKFSATTSLTQLSGGQSRALMIADTALLSKSPIVLIDEIENAGIDRKKALELLVKKGKIVLMSTHDPILALMADKRLIIKNGGIIGEISCQEKERKNVAYLQFIDDKISQIRQKIRLGQKIDFEVKKFMEVEDEM